MSDTNQEELSVEDILSSIKDILVDENDTSSETSATENTLPQVNITEQNVPQISDVFDLDSSMIVNEQKEISELLTATPVEEKSVSLADSIDIEQTLNMAENMDISNIPGLENILEDSAKEKETKAEVKEETIDASANIINNFAKLFAEKQQEQNDSSSITAEKITNSIKEQNITEMVKNAIINQTKLCLDSNFEKIASGIIAEQTKIWLNNNLASIVEKTVAKEIERVIAKVGS